MPANLGPGMKATASGNGNRRISAGSRKTGPKISVPKQGGWGSKGKGGK
jgi:hypothetical protein